MDIVIGAVLLVLVLSIAVLFAMIGELASRIGDYGAISSDQTRLLDDVAVGTTPGYWPDELGDGVDVLVTLSTSCSTCSEIAHATNELLTILKGRGAIAVTGGSCDLIDAFVAQTGLGAESSLTVLGDEMGSWMRSELGLELSPSVVFFDGGVSVPL